MRNTKSDGYTKTTIMGACGTEIICRSCGYTGQAEVIKSTFCAGKLERCPMCRGKNYSEVIIMNWTIDEWKGCYPSNWKGVIVPDAMSHPAKFSSKLIRKIYEHMKEEGWLKEGDMVLDPFGGVGLGALDAMRLGLRWRGIELEAKFVDLGGRNLSNWNVKFSRMPHWCQDAQLLKGDSRFLLKVLQGENGQGAVSSPPYADSINAGEGGIDWEKAGRPDCLTTTAKGIQGANGREERYGTESGQLGAMKAGNFEGAISSPPYADTDLQYKKNGLKVDGKEHYERPYMQGQDDQNYGAEPGQLGGMKADGFNAAISSPPFEERSADGGWQMLGKYAEEGKLTIKQVGGNGHKSYPSWDKDRDTSYGETDGQMGQMKSTETGFTAAISSPPYTGNVQVEKNSTGINLEKQYQAYKASGGGQTFEQFQRTQELHSQGYGHTDGQLGDMASNEFDAAISSPPFEKSEGSATADFYQYKNEQIRLGKMKGDISRGTPTIQDGYGTTEGNLGNMNGDFNAAISSPPFRHSEGGTPEPKPGGSIDAALYARHAAGNSAAEGYGGTGGQLANMEEGDFEGAVSSPPYNLPMSQEHNGKRGGTRGTTPSDPNAFVKYGNTEGQLEGMKDDGFDAAVSSPPYEGSFDHGISEDPKVTRDRMSKKGQDFSKIGDLSQTGNIGYGITDGNIGNDSGDDFWMAARAIVEQVYLALAPGAHAAWVVKGFVKNKEYVDFPDQWRQLCEAVGFVTVHEHRAMLVHSKGTSHTLDGGTVEHKTESKSFFRRLAEKKGSPPVNWETVWCMVKPEGQK